MKQFVAPVVSNRQISRNFYLISFEWDSGAGKAAPGQFFTVRASHSTVPFLRRPFAFYLFENGFAGAIYQKRGRATEILAGKVRKDTLDVIGPLGNAFNPPGQSQCAVAVAGGIGLGPVLFLVRTLRSRGVEAKLIYGARGRENVPDAETFGDIDAAICTEDGSAGYCGTAVDYVRSRGSGMLDSAVVYACGPSAMLRGCHEVASEAGRPCYVSMEQVMACGVGACMGCAIRVTSPAGYARVCADGPVFDSREIAWT